MTRLFLLLIVGASTLHAVTPGQVEAVISVESSGNPKAIGHCGAILKNNKKASVVLIPGGPHTVLMFPQAKGPVEGFLKDIFKL